MIIIIDMNPLEHCLHCIIETTLTFYNFCTFADWDHIYIYFKSVSIKYFSSILICKCSTSVHIASDMYVNSTNTCSLIFLPQDIYIYIYILNAYLLRTFNLYFVTGGLVLSGGLLGFVFSRNLATLSTGVLFGGALLALSTCLKIWRQGKSSLPFILGQAGSDLAVTSVQF